MKVLNCLCYQCRRARNRHAHYRQQFRKVRRQTAARLRLALTRGEYDVDVPEKAKGERAA